MQFFPWGGNGGDLGWEWIIHAERPGPSNPEHKDFSYMGYVARPPGLEHRLTRGRYSLEDQCRKYKHLAEEENKDNTAWLFTKQLTCKLGYSRMAISKSVWLMIAIDAYAGFPEFGWNRSYFDLAARDLQDIGLTFRGAYKIDPTFLPVCRTPRGKPCQLALTGTGTDRRRRRDEATGWGGKSGQDWPGRVCQRVGSVEDIGWDRRGKSTGWLQNPPLTYIIHHAASCSRDGADVQSLGCRLLHISLYAW